MPSGKRLFVRCASWIALTICLSSAAGWVAAQHSPVLEIADPDAPNVWMTSAPTATTLRDVRIRLSGDQGGWIVLALDAYCTHPNAPDWMKPGAQVALASLGPVNAPGQHSHLFEPIAKHMLTTGFTDFWTKATDYDAVRSWYVPLLSGGGTRVWDATPPMWNDPTSTYGEVSKDFWTGMTSTFATGQGVNGQTFNVLAMFRWAVKLRALVDPGVSEAAADEFLESSTFQQALVNSVPSDMGIRLQAIWLCDPSYPPPGTSPSTAPTLAPASLAFSSNFLALPLSQFPSQTAVINPNALLGTFSPGQVVHFSLGNSVTPLFIEFNTQTGKKWYQVQSAVDLRDPNRYRVVVPEAVVPGPIRMKDLITTTPVPIGQVNQVN